jgi:hypothetical protein
VAGGQRISYRTLEEVRKNLGMEGGRQLGEVELADWSALDLRIPRDSPAATMKCYPYGEVPGVRLEMLEK